MPTKKATKARDLPHHKAKIEKSRARKTRVTQFTDKTFVQLSNSEKSILLKNVAEQLGLIKAS